LHRKLTSLKRNIKKEEDIDKDRLVVQLSTCMTKDNYHAPPCPHLDYIRELIAKIGIDVVADTAIYKISEQKRKEGIYKS
jgi:predicted metal-binding protein